MQASRERDAHLAHERGEGSFRGGIGLPIRCSPGCRPRKLHPPLERARPGDAARDSIFLWRRPVGLPTAQPWTEVDADPAERLELFRSWSSPRRLSGRADPFRERLERTQHVLAGLAFVDLRADARSTLMTAGRISITASRLRVARADVVERDRSRVST